MTRTLPGMWRVEAPQIAILAAMFTLALVTWPAAPDRIPVHWNAAGEVDRYGGKFEGLLLLPLIATGVYLLMRYLPRVDPGRANYGSFATTYGVIRVSILVVLAAVYGIVHLWIRGQQVSVSTVIPVLLGGFFIVLGAVMAKIRPNWFVGLRTPWTLSSKAAWVRTHRVGGWLFILEGLFLMVVSPFIEARTAIGVLVAGGIGIVIWSMVYSHLVWKHDPDKIPPADTMPAE